MGYGYTQLSLEERCTIARLHEDGQSLRQIAATMGRSPSSIAREIRRNSGTQVGYRPVYAEERALSRRWRGSRLERNAGLRSEVLERLAQGWSPEQVSGRLAREHGCAVISHESIYRFLYAQIRRTNDYSWRHYLPRGKSKRGWRGRKGGSPARFIQGRISIHERPAAADSRKVPGHWEADLMLFARYGQAVLAAHERTSRLLVLTRQPSKASLPVAHTLKSLLEPLPKSLRRTMTFDNGTEFAQHQLLHELDIKTFFCDTHSPWQKGGIENAIGRMRRTLPRKTDLATLEEYDLLNLVKIYNHTPRKCLDYKTPAEVFSQQLLHFKCESTSRPALA